MGLIRFFFFFVTFEIYHGLQIELAMVSVRRPLIMQLL